MVHFWFGFFLAAMVQVFLKLYVRMIWNWVWNRDHNQQVHQRNDIRQFSGILLVTPSLSLSLVITWFLSWAIFGNHDGFWIFWTYVVFLCISGIKLNDYLAARPSRMRLQALFHKTIWICIFCFFFSSILYGIISSATPHTSDDTNSSTKATTASVASTTTVTLIETTETTLLSTASTATTTVTATTPTMTTSLETLGEGFG